jgi:hypothetical protein
MAGVNTYTFGPKFGVPATCAAGATAALLAGVTSAAVLTVAWVAAADT